MNGRALLKPPQGDRAGDRAEDAESGMQVLAMLEHDCAVCGGTGKTPNAAWQAWRLRAEELIAVAQAACRAKELRSVPTGRNGAAPQVPDTLPDVSAGSAEPSILATVERAIDDHMKTRPSEPQQDPCEDCGGLGKKLTSTGRLLAELLARHGFVRRQ